MCGEVGGWEWCVVRWEGEWEDRSGIWTGWSRPLVRCNDMHSTETIVVTLTLASGSLSPFSD